MKIMQEESYTNENFTEVFTDLINTNVDTQRKISEVTGISPSALANYKKGRIPKSEELYKLAKYFHVTMEELLTGDASPERERAEIAAALNDTENPYLTNLANEIQSPVMMPVLGWAHAGAAVSYDEMPQNYLDSLPLTAKLAKKKVFGLIVEGDSMEPEVHPGDTVAVLLEEEFWSGCLVVSKFNDDDSVQIRRLQKISAGKVRLIPYNQLYHSVEHTLDEFEWIRPIAFVYRDTMRANARKEIN